MNAQMKYHIIDITSYIDLAYFLVRQEQTFQEGEKPHNYPPKRCPHENLKQCNKYLPNKWLFCQVCHLQCHPALVGDVTKHLFAITGCKDLVFVVNMINLP